MTKNILRWATQVKALLSTKSPFKAYLKSVKGWVFFSQQQQPPGWEQYSVKNHILKSSQIVKNNTNSNTKIRKVKNCQWALNHELSTHQLKVEREREENNAIFDKFSFPATLDVNLQERGRLDIVGIKGEGTIYGFRPPPTNFLEQRIEGTEENSVSLTRGHDLALQTN